MPGIRVGLPLALALLLASRVASASDVEQAKQVYAEGLALLDAKDYAGATAKFEAAYALARDRHIFNYNIASAAELAGDCRKALEHYKMFLDLVPKHAARGGAKKAVAKLGKSCVYDDETDQALSEESRGERDAEREEVMAERAVEDAYTTTQQSVARYEAVIAKHGARPPFRGVLRAKRRALAKLDKVMVAHELTPRDPDGPVEAPPTLEQACRQGKAQEERNAAAYLEAYERVEVRRTAKLMDKLERSTRRSHVRAFGRCPRGG